MFYFWYVTSRCDIDL